MARLLGLVLAGGLLLGSASTTEAQVGIAIGNPYAGRGVFIGTPGYGYGYNSGFSGYGYNSGYSGYGNAPSVVAAPAYAVPYARPYGYAPAYGYGYPRNGYGGYGYRINRGFRPFRRW